MQTDHVLQRFELHIVEHLSGELTPSDRQQQLRQFLDTQHHSDREMFIGLAAMRMEPGTLEMLSEALLVPRYRKAFLGGVRKRLSNGVTSSEATMLVELLGRLSDRWPENYTEEIDSLLTQVAKSHVKTAA